MKILLVVPPYGSVYGSFRAALRIGFLNPPLGLCYLASSAKAAGYHTRILDSEAAQLDVAGVISAARDYGPDLIGITATSPEFSNALEVAQALKKSLSTPIVLGGAHVTILGKEVLMENPEFDFGVLGEGEKALVELAAAIEKGGSVGTIAGLVWRNGTSVEQGPAREVEMDLDSLPFPDRQQLDSSKYVRTVPRKGLRLATAFMSTRGCPFRCVYCAVDRIPDRRIARLRSVDNVVAEIVHIVRDLRIEHIVFNDDILTINRKRMVGICEEVIQGGLKFTWEGLTRADLVDEDLLFLMRKAGLVRLSFGIESSNPEVLKLIHKELSLDQVRRAIAATKRAGIVTRGSVIIGLPTETKKTARETIDFAKSLRELDQLVVNIGTPYPGTDYRDMAEAGAHGLRLRNAQPSELRRFGNAVIEVNDLSQDDLIRLQKRALLMFYLQPRRLWRNLTESGLKAGVVNSIAFAKGVLGMA